MIFKHRQLELPYKDLLCETKESGRHYVTPQGKRYPSVTTVLGILHEEDIKAWKDRVGPEEAARVGRFAGARGEDTHTLVERHLKNEELNLRGVMPLTLASYKQIAGVLDERLSEVWLQEFPLYSDHLGMAGRVDIVGRFDGKRSIVDAKTSKRAKTEADIEGYFLQETAYAIMFEEQFGIPITQLVTVMAVDYDKPRVFIEHRDNWVEKLLATIHEYARRKSSG